MVSAGSENPTFVATDTFKYMPKGVVKEGKEDLKATLQEIAQVPAQNKDDTEAAIDAAHDAFQGWAKRTPKERHDLLYKLYHKINEHADDLAHIIVAENGKALQDAAGEVEYSNSFVEWFAEEAVRAYGKTVPAPDPKVRNVVIKQPIGVAGLLAPWNFPLAMITRKLCPALAAGCTGVVKAPCEAPLSALALAQLIDEVGFPKGVVNILVSERGQDEQEMGKTLCESPKIRAVSFTGSTRVGKILAQQSASTLKKLSLELGGNAPFIVFDDADLDLAVSNLVQCKFRCTGETCISANRIYIADAIYDEFSKKLAEQVGQFKVGNGMDKGVTMGPLNNEAGKKKIEEHVKKVKDAGGKIVLGGNAGEGLFFEPTIAQAPDAKQLPTDEEETFGPLAVLYRFKDEADVIKRANDVSVGLGGYFFSQDVGRCFRVGEALEVGMVGINTGMISQYIIPFGGVKESGFGREGGPTGIDEFLEEKTLVFSGL